MAKYAAAIDQGTTSTRCMVFDHGGQVVSVAQKEHEQIYPKPGWVEHDANEIWARTREVVDEAVASAGAGDGDIAAVGITNQRETTLVWAAYSNHWRATEDPGLKLAVFCTAPAIRNTVANIITEIIGTFLLVFGVLAIFANKAVADPLFGLGGLLVGLLVFAIGLSLGGPTGYAINPARDLGPRIMHAILPIPGKGPSDWGYAWIPVIAPLVGGALGGLCFDWWYP